MSHLKPSGLPDRKAKRRRHGYRGYGSPLREDLAGAIHWGRGFGGARFAGEGSGLLLPAAEIVPEDRRGRNTRND
jgi:hypothetical protein